MPKNNKKKKSGSRWYRLDNAAMIVPATVGGSDTRVFRMVCELKEEVDPETLQRALDETAEEFPHFSVVLRKGFFWYYLDGTDKKVRVEEDHLTALSPLYFSGRRNLLYRATYFGKRINVEMFHVLTDGTGGFVFFKRLLMRYFHILYQTPLEDASFSDYTLFESGNDAFQQYYASPEKKKKRKAAGSQGNEKRAQLNKWMKMKAYQIKNPLDQNMQNHILEGIVSASAFLKIAHEYKTTAGVLVVALYIEAVMGTMGLQDRDKPIVIGVPVNLRQYFPSETTRNFYGSIAVSCLPEDYEDFPSLLESVAKAFKEQLQKDKIEANMNSYSELVHMGFIKVLPLSIKDLGIRYYTGKTRHGTTSTLSNVGKVVLPEEISSHIDHFSGFMSSFNIQLCVLTFGDKMSFGFVSAFEEQAVLMKFFRKLTSLGLKVCLSSNDYDRQA
ncbi:MAG: hypothetical protein IJU50_07060 [Lachnospiraceae bacterium]|nr:hypothetical protein [Lachnospiraceae bacterium]